MPPTKPDTKALYAMAIHLFERGRDGDRLDPLRAALSAPTG